MSEGIPTLGARDPIGARTLQIMRRAERYNRWVARLIEPYLGRRVLEIGAGIANMTPWLLGCEHVVATDPEPEYLEVLRRRLAAQRNVEVRPLRLPDVPQEWHEDRLDTVVLLNVLEHVEEDVQSLANLARILQPGARVVVFVPAVPALYGSLDRALGHVRRYTAKGLRTVFSEAHLEVERLRYYNVLGMLGWWFYGRVLGREILPAFEVGLFDRLVPVVARIEGFVRPPRGQSLLAVGRVRG